MTRRWALLAGVLILAGSQPDGHRRPWRSARDSAAEQQVGSGPIVSSAARTAATEYGTFPLAFEPNLGQSERPVEFLARGPGYGVFLTGGHAVIALQGTPSARRNTLTLRFVGADSQAVAAGEDPAAGVANYFVGNDPARWVTDIPTYRRVRYPNVYPGNRSRVSRPSAVT